MQKSLCFVFGGLWFLKQRFQSDHYCERVPEKRKKVILVKYGGSAITLKKQFETLNENALKKTVNQLSEIIKAQDPSSCHSFILIHGAGSFGHFQAHQYDLRSGGGINWKLGLSKTRESVLKLNQMILTEHCEHNLPCVSVSLFPTVTLNENNMTRTGSLDSITHLIEHGLIPITHGDVLLDASRQCAVFSGDRILEGLAKDLHSKGQHEIVAAVFLTDVEGLYDRPPQDPSLQSTDDSPSPKLIPQIYVTPHGKVLTPLQTDSTSSLSHDVTGGIASKIQTAIDIVKETGVEIFLVQVGTPHAARALAGDVTGESEADYRRREDWKGTRISLWKSKELEETDRSLAVLETPSRTSMTE